MSRQPPTHDPHDPDLRQMDVEERALQGGAITGVTEFVRAVTVIGSLVVLARLLEPRDFGLMAITIIVTAWFVTKYYVD